MIIESIEQPDNGTIAETLGRMIRDAQPDEMYVAAAYITNSGFQVLLKVIQENLTQDISSMRIHWITSFDYCRTEPLALEAIMALPMCKVRVHDAEFSIAKRCIPRVPFHPKMFLIRSPQHDYVLAGSGNVSRSGLTRGYEAGLSIGVNRQSNGEEPSAVQSIQQSRAWFSSVWNESKPLSEELLVQYRRVFESAEKLQAPSPTEDDISPDHAPHGTLTSTDLQKLRVCRHFWIEAGRITKNRGPNLPGNQLMMKRLSRVFFGFAPTEVNENSAIGNVALSVDGAVYESYSLTYSDNKMDKIILPIPGDDADDGYDGKTLLFREIAPGRFDLTLGSDRDKRKWRTRSRNIRGNYTMKGGREWGVF